MWSCPLEEGARRKEGFETLGTPGLWPRRKMETLIPLMPAMTQHGLTLVRASPFPSDKQTTGL